MTIVLAVWAAVLSTVLAAIKIWETWSSRQRISVGYGVDFTGEQGSSIVIQNPSGTPLLINYWILLVMRRNGLRWHSVDCRIINAGDYYVTIGAHDHHTLHFKGKESFAWIPKDNGKARVVLELSVAGRSRPMRLRVYNTDSKDPQGP